MPKNQQNELSYGRSESRPATGLPAVEGGAGGDVLSRREVLKRMGTGMLAAPLTQGFAKAPPAAESELLKATPPAAESTSGKIPFSLIIDDGSPVDPLFYEIPGYETPLLVPHEFTTRVAETMERFELRGKMTLIPMPSCLGRIDQSLKRVPPEHLEGFLKIVRERIAPRFDITPEFITHLNAYNLKTGRFQHIYEDEWISRAPIEEIIDYFVLAFTILKNVGINSTGLTSPWDSGMDVEKKYAQALGAAQSKVWGRDLAWYFLWSVEWRQPRPLSIEYQDAARHQTVVSVPANAPDIFWSMERPTLPERKQFIKEGIDRLVSEDGRTGRIRELIEGGFPVILLTHWQSLYTQGTGLGLEGLQTLMERIQKVFGNTHEWISCSERAKRLVESQSLAKTG
ncbi:MAG: hypothetical protein ABSG32_21900 [Terriglobia bacterium]|jgi:hypothetical protein